MPLPAIEDVFQKLGDSALFCVKDITKGFWNVPISPESRKDTAFTLRNIGLFEYLLMPMGLKTSPATFAQLCKLVFPSQDFKEFLQFFLDDLCIFCKDFKALLPALDKVLVGPGPGILAYGLRGFLGRGIPHIKNFAVWHMAYCSKNMPICQTIEQIY
jgi:hypothetical protein